MVVGAGPNGLVGRQPSRRCRLVGARPRGAARGRRRRAQRPRRAPRLRARHVQRLLPAGGGLAGTAGTSTSSGTASTWRHAPAVLGHPLPDGALGAAAPGPRGHRRGCWTTLHPGDGEAWLRAVRAVGPRSGTELVGVLLSPFPPVRAGLGTLARLPRVGGLDFVRTLLTPAATWAADRFGGEAPRLLLAGNAGHADIPLDAPGSGLMAHPDDDARPDRRLPGARGRRGRADPGAGPPARGRCGGDDPLRGPR